MTIAIISIIIGALILAAGAYYLVKEKHDPESRKIYSVISVIGAVVLIAMVLKLIFWC